MSSTLRWRVSPGRPATAPAPGTLAMADVPAWLKQVRPELTAALHEHGAVVVRGLPMAGVEDFALVRDALISARTPYREKATPRSRLGDDVFSSTDLPASQAIRMHNENSYTLTFPGLLLFGCLTAPAEGGATPVADCREVLRSLPEPLAARMHAVGWRLTRAYSELVSLDWRTAFATEDPAEVERYCAEALIGCGWQPDGALRTAQVRPGVITHPRTGEQAWFNHLLFWNSWALDEEIREAMLDEFGAEGLPFQTSFGDGAMPTDAELAAIQSAYDGATVRQSWEPGDVMLVDNILAAHGRDPFRGERRIVVAMGDPVELAECRPGVAPAAVVP